LLENEYIVYEPKLSYIIDLTGLINAKEIADYS